MGKEDGHPGWTPVHGDAIRIPRGTTVYETGLWRMDPIAAGRSATSTVETVWDFAADGQWERFVTDEDGRALEEAARAAGRPAGRPWGRHWIDGDPVFDRIRTRILSQHGGDMRYVSWGGRMAHVTDVEPAERKAAKERAPGLRDRMTPGSVWRTTRDLAVTCNIWRGYVEPTMIWNIDRTMGSMRDRDVIRHRNAQPEDIGGDMMRVVMARIAAGTTLTVRNDKATALGRDNGIGIPFEMDEGDAEWTFEQPYGLHNPLLRMPTGQSLAVYLPLKQIEGAVEMVEEVPATFHVLREEATGLLFAGFTHDWSKGSDHLRMVETITSARKFATPAAARASVMAWTGRIPKNEGGDQPEWVGWEKKMDLPEGWVLVPVDRATLRMGAPVDIGDWA